MYLLLHICMETYISAFIPYCSQLYPDACFIQAGARQSAAVPKQKMLLSIVCLWFYTVFEDDKDAVRCIHP